MKCLMCGRKPARKLTAKFKDENGEKRYYVNGKDVHMFCSVRCAANHALLWSPGEYHFCPHSGEWEHYPGVSCVACCQLHADRQKGR